MAGDSDMSVRVEAAAAALQIARATIAELQAHTQALSAAIQEAKQRWANGDMQLRAREAAVLAREDRATMREREIDEAFKKLDEAR